MTIAIESRSEGVIVPVRAKPGARRTGVVGEHAGALRIDVAAAPEKGRANEAIAAVLAELFGVAKSRVELVSGAAGREKRFLIAGVTSDAVSEAIAAALADL